MGWSIPLAFNPRIVSTSCSQQPPSGRDSKGTRWMEMMWRGCLEGQGQEPLLHCPFAPSQVPFPITSQLNHGAYFLVSCKVSSFFNFNFSFLHILLELSSTCTHACTCTHTQTYSLPLCISLPSNYKLIRAPVVFMMKPNYLSLCFPNYMQVWYPQAPRTP